ncbi:MAG: ATP-binding protein [Chloroflexota bacterium]
MTYSDKNIPKLTPREHIRRRPGVYVGGTGKRGLHHLVYEILDHMAEEAYINRCDHIWVDILANDKIRLRDNSQGLPTERYEGTDLIWLEAIIEDLGVPKTKFDEDAYKVMGGLHGLGIAPVNMLSQNFTIENYRNGTYWRKTYQQGIASSPLIRISDEQSQSTQGLLVEFQPDETIFDDVNFDRTTVENRAEQIARLTPNLTVEVTDHREPNSDTTIFYYAEGLKTWVEEQTKSSHIFHNVIHIQEEVKIPTENNPNRMIGIEIAFQFSDSSEGQVLGYVNTVRTPKGGTHIAPLKATILSALNEYIEYEYSDFDSKNLLTWNDIKDGLFAVISIRHPDPQFQSPTKLRLNNKDIYGAVANLIYSNFNWDYYNNRKMIDSILNHLLGE